MKSQSKSCAWFVAYFFLIHFFSIAILLLMLVRFDTIITMISQLVHYIYTFVYFHHNNRFSIFTVRFSHYIFWCIYIYSNTHCFFREIAAARAMLNQYAGIPLGKIKGFRAPFCKHLYSSQKKKELYTKYHNYKQ